MKRNNKGFTLVELMAVVAVIVILIGFLMPALRTARQQARKAQNLSRLRQLGIALHAQAMDNQGRFTNSLDDLDDYLDDLNVKTPISLPGGGDTFLPKLPDGDQLVENVESYKPLFSVAVPGGFAILYADGHVEVRAADAAWDDPAPDPGGGG